MVPVSFDAKEQRQYLQHVKGLFKAEVYISTLADGSKVVCKDYSRFRNRPLAKYLARYLVRREYKVLHRLNAWAYAPKVLHSPDDLVLVQEYIVGKPVETQTANPCSVFSQLQQALKQLHQFGIAHNDIHASNILVRTDGRPVLIDFTSASLMPRLLSLRWLQKKMFSYDARHLAKIKKRMGCPLQAKDLAQLQRSKSLEAILALWKTTLLPGLKLLYKR